MPTRRITDATVEPVTLAEAKMHLRVDHADEDAYISARITAVRQAAEHIMQRTILQTTWQMVRDDFAPALRLEYPRIIAVQALEYTDAAGVSQTLDPADYTLDAYSEPGYIVPAPGKSWPTTYGVVNAVRVTYTAGYGATAETVPAPIRQWILLQLESAYRNRGAVISSGLQPLAFTDRLLDVGRVWPS